MFSVQQKREIANKIQQILRDTNHPELPVTEIEFMLHVNGRLEWSWADIRNNGIVPNPSINPWNEAQDKNIPTKEQHSREPDKVKLLAQYLDDYIEHEVNLHNIDSDASALHALFLWDTWQQLLEQALDAYQSTENVTIKIERA